MPMISMEERLLLQYFGSDPEKLADARRRLSLHEPLAYILGETVFFDETYKVTPAVLIPRRIDPPSRHRAGGGAGASSSAPRRQSS